MGENQATPPRCRSNNDTYRYRAKRLSQRIKKLTGSHQHAATKRQRRPASSTVALPRFQCRSDDSMACEFAGRSGCWPASMAACNFSKVARNNRWERELRPTSTSARASRAMTMISAVTTSASSNGRRALALAPVVERVPDCAGASAGPLLHGCDVTCRYVDLG